MNYLRPTLLVVGLLILVVYFLGKLPAAPLVYSASGVASSTVESVIAIVPPPALDRRAYNEKMVKIANYGRLASTTGISATSTAWDAPGFSISSPKNPWPVKTAYPNAGALLPFNRVVAYYGNFYSTRMGILGEYPEAVVIQKLKTVVSEWEAADPETPVIPAVAYIAVTAQESAGADGKYRLRMPDDQIQQAIALADKIHGIVFLDVQPGLSTLQAEVPLLEKYLKMPQVHLALDPEFSMKTGARPGTVIGTMDATDVNYAANYLAGVVKANNIPPKMLLVHRFTQNMLTNYKKIKPLPEVQVVINMDGWGAGPNKTSIYGAYVQDEPVQFGGIKLFYKNDLKKPSTGLLTLKQLLKLKPQPIFVEYQ